MIGSGVSADWEMLAQAPQRIKRHGLLERRLSRIAYPTCHPPVQEHPPEVRLENQKRHKAEENQRGPCRRGRDRRA